MLETPSLACLMVCGTPPCQLVKVRNGTCIHLNDYNTLYVYVIVRTCLVGVYRAYTRSCLHKPEGLCNITEFAAINPALAGS